ncbi:MAG: hypothetical protein RIS35_1175 [Pseudomonadota bacterium]|jgi:DNA-binding IclR family transcriptional regulator
MSTSEEREAPHLVPAVERAVRLLDALAGARSPKSLADLARELALPKSSVHGLLSTLVALGLARRDADHAFSLGTRPLQWADAYASQSDVMRAFDACLDDVDALRAETVMLAILDGTEVTYLACRQGTRALAVNFRVGGRFPASCTSSGKAMLASLPDARVEALYARAPLQRLTRHSIGNLDALRQQLQAFRRDGFAVDDEETAEGMHCFGAAVYAARRTEAVAAVAVSSIKASISGTQRDRLVASIRELAARMSTVLGAAPNPASPQPAGS